MIKLATKRLSITFLLVIIGLFPSQAQSSWTELSEMPMAITNNAVSQAVVADTLYVYSFGGLDSTKLLTGITQQSMRYNTVSDIWSFIPSLPDSLGKIASGASTVNNILYITGGYHVFNGAPFELSSDKIHRYDPVSNTYLTDGAPMPHPIDDHVQAVWRDSLIFMITGWSNNSNVPFVQIYNPVLDAWSEGSPTPNNASFTSFGASGVIIGDTIYYNGGAAGSSFSASSKLRRGIINPEDPTDIAWELMDDNPGDKGYRMAAVAVGNQAFWIGGSGITYNYNGIAYNGSGGVPPLHRILSYNRLTSTWYQELDQPYGIMDLRGLAKVGDNAFIICGGMGSDQEVSKKTFLINIDVSVGIEELKNNGIAMYPNPVSAMGDQKVRVITSLSLQQLDHITMYNNLGQQVEIKSVLSDDKAAFSVQGLETGLYNIHFHWKDRQVTIERLMVIQ